MPNVLLLEPDRVSARCITTELKKRNIDVVTVSTAESAVSEADKLIPDLVICELSLPGHSGSEFIYEFRTYNDWENIPLIIYTSIKASDKVTQSRDWKLLNITEILYKPDYSLQKLGDIVKDLV